MFLFRGCQRARACGSLAATPTSNSPATPPTTSSPLRPLPHNHQHYYDQEESDEDGSFRRANSSQLLQARRNTEFFSQFASSLQDETSKEIILQTAREQFCAEVFNFLSSVLELESVPRGKLQLAFAQHIVDQFVREGAPQQNHLSSQTRLGLLQHFPLKGDVDATTPALSDRELDRVFLPALYEVIQDVKMNPALRQIALSCSGVISPINSSYNSRNSSARASRVLSEEKEDELGNI